MTPLSAEFQSLPEEYQHLLRLVQDTYQLTIAPLQLLVGGWSGAAVFLVSLASHENGRIEHAILKLDHKNPNSKNDEVSRHNTVLSQSPPAFAAAHIPELVYPPLEYESAIAIFYRIAGQSLLNYLPLSKYTGQNQLKTIFTATYANLAQWNEKATFQQALHPQKLLARWLGFRLDPGRNIEQFLQNQCRVNPDTAGFLINGSLFPNPLAYARSADHWGKARPIDVATGFIHGDLNTNNILVKYSEKTDALDGFYLIDFALFKENMPLLYDQRYLEMSYLILALSQVSFPKVIRLMTTADLTNPHQLPVEMAGVGTVIATARQAFGDWVQDNHPSLHDDLWGQYWLAAAAAGLSYCHKPGLPDEIRLAGLIYAAANLKQYATIFNLQPPTTVEFLYNENSQKPGSTTGSPAEPPTGSPTSSQPRHNLPPQPTPFLGRSRQLTAVTKLLQEPNVRLVTLLGPGGTGKTRLSLEAAHELLPQFPDGTWFVPLADDTDVDQLVARIAQQLAVRQGSRPLLESLTDYLRDRKLLLVLDNFEQLVAAAPSVATLMAAAPGLKILVSSRIPLNLHGEQEYPVPPLELPPKTEILETLAENEAIRFFVSRAQSAKPGFALTEENATAVSEICHHLDGLPLALELAAARVKLLPPQAILSRLDDRFKLLTGGGRDLPSRHQALRNTLEWSYGLLNEEEKTLYGRLGIFVGGFTYEAAEAVCTPGLDLDILDGLTALVNNSLLRQDETASGEPRFTMLETIRAYALEQLTQSGELETLQELHAGYFGKMVLEEIGYQLYTPKATYWLDWLEREHDNLRATLTWSLAAPQRIALAAPLVYALNWFWYRRGYCIEGRIWSEKVLASPAIQNQPRLHAFALQASGMLALWTGKQATALAQLRQSLDLEMRLEDDFRIAGLHMANAVALINMGRDKTAQSYLEIAQRYFIENDQPYFHAITTVHQGNMELGLGNPEKARALLEVAESKARALNENWILSFALNNLGEVARSQGQYDLARNYYLESAELLRQTGDKGDVARFIHNLGYIAQHEGDLARAEKQFRRSLTIFREVGNNRGIAECLAALAGLSARQSDPQRGAVLLSAAEQVLKSTGGAWWPADRPEIEHNRDLIQTALTPDDLTSASKQGQAMTLDQAIAYTTS